MAPETLHFHLEPRRVDDHTIVYQVPSKERRVKSWSLSSELGTDTTGSVPRKMGPFKGHAPFAKFFQK